MDRKILNEEGLAGTREDKKLEAKKDPDCLTNNFKQSKTIRKKNLETIREA